MRQQLFRVLVLAGSILSLAAFAGAGESASVGLGVGDQLVYEAVDSTDAAASGTADGRGHFISLPEKMKVVVTGEVECADHSCLVVEAEADMPQYRIGDKQEPDQRKIKALIDPATGDVLDIKSEVHIGGSTSISTQGRLRRHSSLYHFYGPWMADLHDGYDQSYDNHPSGAAGNVAVTGRAEIDGHQCFVVRKVKETSSGEVVESKIWVDVKRRIVVRLEEGGRVMKLAS